MNTYTEVLDEKTTKIVLMILGALITPIVIFIGMHGLVLGYGGFLDFDPLLLGTGFITVLGLAGLVGAWYRLFKNLPSMSMKQRSVTRVLLFCGIASGISLVGGCIYSGIPFSITTLCLILSIGGYFFVMATPKRF